MKRKTVEVVIEGVGPFEVDRETLASLMRQGSERAKERKIRPGVGRSEDKYAVGQALLLTIFAQTLLEN